MQRTINKIILILSLLSTLIFNIGCQSKQQNIEVSNNYILKQKINNLLKKHSEKLKSKNIIISILDNKTNKIIYTSDKDIAKKYKFEANKLLDPIIVSIALDNSNIKANNVFKAYNNGLKNKKGFYPNGKLKIDKYIIKDNHRYNKNKISLTDIVAYSSDIGIYSITQKLSKNELLNGYKLFNINTNKYPIIATHNKLLYAYSVFNNNGILKNKQILKVSTVNTMKKLLIDIVKKGTGRGTNINNLEIGGKTSTTNLIENGKYVKKYVSSFFGFINDNKSNKYTIGVTVIEPISTGKNWYYYYASQSAVPIFNDVVKILIKIND